MTYDFLWSEIQMHPTGKETIILLYQKKEDLVEV